MQILKINGLSKRFGDKTVLDGVDLSVGEKTIFGFVGKNGAGKTTTMKAILGLIHIDGGEIEVLGERVTYGSTKTNRHIGYLPDVPEFYAFMTAREYLKLSGESLGLSRGEIEARSYELLKLVGLADEKHRIGGYSRGMKQRLGIAQALLGKPKLLICDEPTSALDPIGRREILEILKSVKNETTVLFSSHILSDVEDICTDVALLDGGKIIMRGTVDELKARYSPSEYAITLVNPSDNSVLSGAFIGAKTADDGALIFSETDVPMESVLSFAIENGIKLRKVERIEPSLEALFMEVVGR